MITIKTLRFSNTFSYGEDNVIDFTKNQLTQLVGKNGHGKSSIALVLEEVLFNKNSKGIKKSDVLNRYGGAKQYSISLEFSKDGQDYLLETKRGATQTVRLLQNGEDISSHTSTATYKQVEAILGMNHKTFSQLVYQSSSASLEFLTSPDTARKKFLIEILDLQRYSLAGEVFKEAHTSAARESGLLEAQLANTQKWLAKHKASKLEQKPLLAVPEPPLEQQEKLRVLQQQLLEIGATNAKISKNLQYKAELAKYSKMPVPSKPDGSVDEYVGKAAAANARYMAAKQVYQKLANLHGTCPTCLGTIDSCKTEQLVQEQQNIMLLQKEEETANNLLATKLRKQLAQYRAALDNNAQLAKYTELVDLELPDTLLVAGELDSKIRALQLEIQAVQKSIDTAAKENAKIIADNAKAETLQLQIEEMQAELEEQQRSFDVVNARAATLAVLAKTFSTTGLVAYKIENLVKDLEDLSNQYLGDLSGGRFQLGFKVSGSDKLNVIITDNGTDIDIAALSGGERARVNVATLLAIRKLMQGLSNSRVNLLILDETVEALDAEGKDLLVDVLLQEDKLNTVLVSHGFQHPLLEKLHVVKQHNISKIEG